MNKNHDYDQITDITYTLCIRLNVKVNCGLLIKIYCSAQDCSNYFDVYIFYVFISLFNDTLSFLISQFLKDLKAEISEDLFCLWARGQTAHKIPNVSKSFTFPVGC